MKRIRKGYWMAEAADAAGKGEEGTGIAGIDTENVSGGSSGDGADDTGNEPDLSAELAKLRTELAKQKTSLDKATKEAADYKRQLKSRMTVDEAAAEEKKIADEALKSELEDLRKKIAVAELSKTVVTLGGDENASDKIASMLYGADDAEGALREIQKIWTAREKALRLEFSKVPAPSSGSTEGPTITKEQLSGLGYKERLEFARKNPEEYNKLMGR